MASDSVGLLHSVPRSRLDVVLRDGLLASSDFHDLGLGMRRGVVYYWLRREDDKMWGDDPDYAYLSVTVDGSQCRVADMEFCSISL